MNSTINGRLYFIYSEPLTNFEKSVIIFFCSIFLFGLFANLLLIWTFLTVKKLRTSHNGLIINLAFSDLLIIGYIMPTNMAAIVIGDYPLPNQGCLLNSILAYLSFTVSTDSLMVIALNRYVKICKGHLYDKIFTNKFTFAMVFAMWMLGCILMLPYVLFDGGMGYDQTIQMCLFNRYMKGPYPSISMIIAIFVPVSVTLISYIKIYRHFKQVKQQLIQVINNSTAKASLTQNVAVARSCFVIFVTSLIGLTPFGVSSIFYNEATDLPVQFHMFAILVAFSNNAANSIIYGIMNRNIREGYKQKLSCIFKRNAVHSEESSTHMPKSSVLPPQKQQIDVSTIYRSRQTSNISLPNRHKSLQNEHESLPKGHESRRNRHESPPSTKPTRIFPQSPPIVDKRFLSPSDTHGRSTGSSI